MFISLSCKVSWLPALSVLEHLFSLLSLLLIEYGRFNYFFLHAYCSYSAPDSFDISYGSKLDESGWHLLLLLAGETEPWRVNTCEHAAPINWQRSCEWHKNCARSKMEQVRQEAKHLFLFEKNSDLEWAVIEPNGATWLAKSWFDIQNSLTGTTIPRCSVGTLLFFAIF